MVCGRYGRTPAALMHRIAQQQRKNDISACIIIRVKQIELFLLIRSSTLFSLSIMSFLSGCSERIISIEYQCYDNSRDVIRITNAYHACDVDRVVKLTRLHGAAGPWQVVTPLVASGGFVDGG